MAPLTIQIPVITASFFVGKKLEENDNNGSIQSVTLPINDGQCYMMGHHTCRAQEPGVGLRPWLPNNVKSKRKATGKNGRQHHCPRWTQCILCIAVPPVFCRSKTACLHPPPQPYLHHHSMADILLLSLVSNVDGEPLELVLRRQCASVRQSQSVACKLALWILL